MFGLQAALPDAAIFGASAYSDEKSRRQQDLTLLRELPQLFATCGELTDIEIEAVFDEERGGDGEVYRTCFATGTFTFAVSTDSDDGAPSVARLCPEESERSVQTIETITTDGPGIIDSVIDDLIEDLCAAGDSADVQDRLEQSRASMTDLMTRYENGPKIVFEADPTFWSAHPRIMVSRKMYEDCLIDGSVDLDALRVKLRLAPRVTSERVEISDMAPPHWNAVNIHTLHQRLACGMSPLACDNDGVSPLVVAAAFGQSALVEALLEAGADVNSVDANGFTAFTAAVACGNKELLPFLVERGANPDGTQAVPALLLAVARNRGGEMMRAVVSAGAAIEALTPSGKPFCAVFEKYFDRANRETRDEVAQIVNSLSTEHEVFAALDHASGVRGSRRLKAGPSL